MIFPLILNQYIYLQLEAERICGNQAKAMPNAVWSDLVRVWEMLSLSLLILTPAKQESQFQAYLLLL